MRSLKFIFAFLVIFFIFFSAKPLFAKKNKSRLNAKDYVVQKLKINPVTHLSISGPFIVHLKQGNCSNLMIETNESDLNFVKIQQSGEKLKIKLDKTINWVRINQKIDIFITTQDLSMIDLKGAAIIVGQSCFKTDHLKISARGPGELTLGIEVEKLNVAIRGSGLVKLTGFAKHQDIEVAGSGKYKATELESETADINVKGSGYSYLNVEKELNVKVYGSGNVIYKGSPSIQSQAYGSGKVKAM